MPSPTKSGKTPRAKKSRIKIEDICRESERKSQKSPSEKIMKLLNWPPPYPFVVYDNVVQNEDNCPVPASLARPKSLETPLVPVKIDLPISTAIEDKTTKASRIIFFLS